jgi:hypothetical protein
MPKTEIDYSNTIIYKITCKNQTIKDVYVGHTTNFVQRKHGHKQSCLNTKALNHNCKLYEVIRANGGWENWQMEIINFFNCADHYEARKREQEYFISLNATLNSIEPFPKPKVVVKNNNKNKDCLNKINSVEPQICELCNYACLDVSNFKKHTKTEKHKLNMKEKNINTTEKNTKTTESDNTKNRCNICNKQYKNRNGLWYHKKKCVEPESLLEFQISVINTLLDDNKDFKNMIIELTKSNMDLQKKMIEIKENI